MPPIFEKEYKQFKKMDITKKYLREAYKYMKILIHLKCLFILVRKFTYLQNQFRIESI